MGRWLRHVFEGRAWWLNALMAFCAYMAVVYVPWDFLMKPVAQDEEVWFGIVFHGWAAKLLEIPHWFVYAAGTYGFRRGRPWMRTWAPLYVAQVGFSALVWSLMVVGGFLGLLAGLVAALPFAGLALLLRGAEEHFPDERPSLRDRYAPGGEWALVTGASAGIGADFARALARDGLSLVLTARREDRLRSLADELEKSHGVETRVVAADLCSPTGADELADRVADLDIAVLVNNAGFGLAGRFDKLDLARLREQVEVNCVAPLVLTHRLLPGMRARSRGAVVFTGSVAGRQPLPLHAVYSATKAFDLFLGESLWAELREEGIDVIVVEPGSTETEFQQVAGEIAHGGAAPAQVVSAALDALGKQPSVITGWFDWLRTNLAQRLLPRDLVVSVAGDVIEGQTPREMR